MSAKISMNPIGVFICDKNSPAETASQGSLDESGERGLIELYPGYDFERAVRGLGTMSHLWVLFHMHKKTDWKPLVQVPRGSEEKQGVFATRSPHRPNAIGLSLVKIDEVSERKIWVKGFDIMNGSPILDIKPFHPEADLPDNPRFGWMEFLNADEHHITFSETFQKQAEFLFARGIRQLPSFCKQQLRFDPFNAKKKRVEMTSETTGLLAYRTWRIHFSFAELEIRLEFIRSGYTEKDFDAKEDRWGDRKLHLDFIEKFGG